MFIFLKYFSHMSLVIMYALRGTSTLLMYVKSKFLSDHTCMFVCVCQKTLFSPADVTRPVWETSSPLFLPSSIPSCTYISSINPILVELLWSLCVLWAMVIICLLRSCCFTVSPVFSIFFSSYSLFFPY